MKRKQINYLGFLSLLSLIALLGLITENEGFYGFFGFFYYLRYFQIVPDEMFLSYVQKSATAAFFAEMLSLVLFMFGCSFVLDGGKAIATAFALSFAVGIFVFTIVLIFYEWKEQRGAAHD